MSLNNKSNTLDIINTNRCKYDWCGNCENPNSINNAIKSELTIYFYNDIPFCSSSHIQQNIQQNNKINLITRVYNAFI